jgi:hypothetical protein
MSSVFEYRGFFDVMSRFLGVGIFAIENYNHLVNFESEVQNMVIPALSPMPPVVCSIVHGLTIFLGLGGSLCFLLSGLKSFRKLARPGLRSLLLFMLIITWNWWFRRNGEYLWEVQDPIDKRNRVIHCLKNASIFGLLSTILLSHPTQIKRD